MSVLSGCIGWLAVWLSWLAVYRSGWQQKQERLAVN